jgi:peptidoglycan biosynthesis protein MviN/MurJ (putative lipid II flippase)
MGSFSGVTFGLPMAAVSFAALLTGAIPILLGWFRITGQWHSTGKRTVPKGLCALTASICVDPAGFLIYWSLDYSRKESFTAFLICATSIAVGILLNLTALLMPGERKAVRAAVIAGSIAIALVNVLGLIWLFVVKKQYSL